MAGLVGAHSKGPHPRGPLELPMLTCEMFEKSTSQLEVLRALLQESETNTS